MRKFRWDRVAKSYMRKGGYLIFDEMRKFLTILWFEKKILFCRYINYKICAESLLFFSRQQLRLDWRKILRYYSLVDFLLVTHLTD
jgi:hypothetical protein